MGLRICISRDFSSDAAAVVILPTLEEQDLPGTVCLLPGHMEWWFQCELSQPVVLWQWAYGYVQKKKKIPHLLEMHFGTFIGDVQAFQNLL